MNEYELVSIIHPRLNADETTAAIANIQAQIEANGGEMLSTDVWGRRRLAYPIKHLLEGTYVLMTFKLAPEKAPVHRNPPSRGAFRATGVRAILPPFTWKP